MHNALSTTDSTLFGMVLRLPTGFVSHNIATADGPVDCTSFTDMVAQHRSRGSADPVRDAYAELKGDGSDDSKRSYKERWLSLVAELRAAGSRAPFSDAERIQPGLRAGMLSDAYRERGQVRLASEFEAYAR